MCDRVDLLETALDSLPDGIALFGMGGEVLFWNQAAEAITGYACADVMARPVPRALEPLAQERAMQRALQPDVEAQAGHGALVKVRHKAGYELQAMTRVLMLRDGFGERIGTAAVFHSAENLDAIPHGSSGDDQAIGASQAELEDQLRMEFEDLAGGGLPFGVLWIGVDQAQGLRKTHGSSACESMLEKVRQALTRGLRPTEVVGRWGDDEFLIISHERTAEILAAHARVLAGLARTADFRWWGDRISLTVSIGAAQACEGRDEELAQLLLRAQKGMEQSIRGGGNSITSAAGGQECLRS